MAARIAGVMLPSGKHAEIALTYIYGVGRSKAQLILHTVKIERTRKQHDQSVREAHDHTTNTLCSITKRMDEVEQEIVRCKEDHRKELA